MIGKEIRSSELKTTTGIQQTRKDSEPILPSITGGFFDYDNEVRNSSPSNPETATASTPKEPIITTSNLYKHAPTIVFIKEKYKNYLEWLASNYAANNAQDQTQPKSSSSPTTSHHLAWYDFEQSLSRKQKSDNSHVRSVGSTATAAEKDEMLRYSLEHLDSSMASQNHKLLAAVLNSLRNSKEFNATAEKQRRLGLKLDLDAVRRPQMGEAQKKSTKKQMPPPPRKLDPLGSRESPSNNTTSNQRQGVNNTQTKSQQQQQNISNQRQAQIPVNPSPSRVQFMTEHHDPKYPLTNLTTTTTSSSTTGNYYQYQTSVNSTPPILKPILKHAQSSMTVNPGVSSCSKRSSNAGGDYLQLVYLKRSQRKSSSTGSSSSNDDQASQSGASTSSSSSSYGDAAAFASLPNSKPLLPPILPLAARCSDDFYAVLNDMEKSKYV